MNVRLTVRESEVMIGLAKGLSAKQIAGEIGCSRKTVEVHKYRAYSKLGAHNADQAVAICRGLAR